MPDKRETMFPLTCLAAVLLAAVTLLLSGCAHMAEWDKRIWGEPAQTYTVKEPDGTVKTITTGTARPGIIDIVATALAAFGFTGMGVWIKRVRSAANGNYDELAEKVTCLDAKLAALKTLSGSGAAAPPGG